MGILNSHVKKKQEEIKKKRKPGGVSETAFVPINIKLIDAYCGTIATDTEGENFLNLGVPMGKIHMAVGHSQSGKTTLLLQIANAMVEPLNGDVILADFERSSTDPRTRIKNICGIDDDTYESRFTIFNHEEMTAEFLKKTIFEIAEVKKNLGKDDLVDWYDLEGREVKIYPPTVIIIDSVSAMRPKELLENPEMDNNMVNAKIAASNGSFLVSIEHLLEAYNITILAVGHIGTKIVTNAYAPRKVQLPGLADDESIGGGNKFIFMSSYLFKLTAGKELKDDKDMKIQGRIVNLRFLKTRSGFNSTTVPLVYHSVRGFHSRLTDFYWLKEQGVLKGGGSKGFFLPGNEEMRYTQSDWAKLLVRAENEDDINAFDEFVDGQYQKLIEKKQGSGDGAAASSADEDIDQDFEE